MDNEDRERRRQQVAAEHRAAIAPLGNEQLLKDSGFSDVAIEALRQSKVEEAKIAQQVQARRQQNLATLQAASVTASIPQHAASHTDISNTSMDDLRELLRVAIQQHVAAEDDASAMSEVVNNCLRHNAELQQQLAEFDQLDDQILRWRSNEYKRGQVNGIVSVLPDELELAERSRTRLADELLRNSTILGRLEHELQECQAEAKTKSTAVERCANAVACKQAEAMALDLKHLEDEAQQLRGELLAVAQTWASNGKELGPLPLTKLTRSILAPRPAPQPDPALKAMVKAWRDLLTKNASAELEQTHATD